MDASHLLGALLNSDYGRGRGPDDNRRRRDDDDRRDGGGGIGVGTMALGAVGVAAVGGLGYLAYKHFTGAQNPGQPGMMGGQPGMMGPGMGGQGMQPAGGGGPGFLGGILGNSGGMRSDGFTAPGYEYQQHQSPQQQPQQQGYAPPPAAPMAQGYAPQGYAPPGYAPPGYAPPQNVGYGPPPGAPAPPPVNYGALPQQPPGYQAADAAPLAAPAPSAAAPAPSQEQQRDALLLVRAMIAASFADGTLDDKERADILSRIDRGGIGPAEREAFLKELDAPKPIMLLASQVKTPELAEQFYLVSGLSISQDSEAEKAHLAMLPSLLKLTPAQVAGIHQRAGWPPL